MVLMGLPERIRGRIPERRLETGAKGKRGERRIRAGAKRKRRRAEKRRKKNLPPSDAATAHVGAKVWHQKKSALLFSCFLAYRRVDTAMTHRFKPRRAALAVLTILCVSALTATAQEEDWLLLDGVPLENAIAGRNLALRLRAEVQITDDDDSIIETDPEYDRFPTELYTYEAKLFQGDKASISARHAQWENEQGLDVDYGSLKLRAPLPSDDEMIYDSFEAAGSSYLTFKYRFKRDHGEDSRKTYLYLGYDRTFSGGLYSYIQYRLTSIDGERSAHQLYEFLSWRVSDRFRIGEQAACTGNEGKSSFSPWYARIFATYFLVEDTTAVRLQVRHYKSSTRMKYQRYNTYIYQKIGSRTLARVSHRFYDDNAGLSSHAFGVKFKRYFSPRLSAHIGYRYYDHNKSADFDTFFGGMGLLL